MKISYGSHQNSCTVMKNLQIYLDIALDRFNRMSLTELGKETENILDSMAAKNYDFAVAATYLEAMNHKSPIPTLSDAEMRVAQL